MSHKLGSPEQLDRVEARKKAKRLRDEIEEKLNEADDCFHDMESKAKDLSTLRRFCGKRGNLKSFQPSS
jgi:hypothetical protein